MPGAPQPTRPQVAHAASLLGRKTAAITFFTGLVASVAAFFVLRHTALDDSQRALYKRAREITRAIEAKVALPLQSLEAVVAYRRALPPDRKTFEVFARTLLARHPSVAALEYAEVVPHAERAALEARISADAGRPITIREPDADGRMVPSPVRDRYTVLTSLEPWNDDVIGLDVGFEPDRRAALEHAAERGERFCSSRIRLVEDPPGVYSVVVYEPEFERATPPSDPIERRRQVRGYAIALFRLDPLVQRALDGLDTEGLDLVVLDKDELGAAATAPPPSAGATPFDGGEDRARLYPSRAHPSRQDDDAVSERELTFAGRTWLVRIRAPLEAAAGTAWIVLALGAALSLFLAVALGALAESRRFRREVRQIRRLGQYEVTRLVAAGGMGKVFEARHRLLKRRTALKVVDHAAADEDTLRRFEREVHATSLLTHPNTVVVYDYGRSGHGQFYYAMEFIEGPSFDELVRLEGSLTPERVKHLLVQVVGALAEAHGQGFVHRDVKPANLMVTVRGGRHDFVKVLDFGLVRDLHGKQSRITTTGSVSGTPGYLPPEVFASPAAIGPPVDVYAVGCVAHLLLTGHEVFESPQAAEVVAAHLGLEPEAPSQRFGVSPTFDALILKCLAKDPKARYADAGALLAALEALPLAAWAEADAEASWRRWENARAALAPAETALPVPSISHIEVALGAERVEDRRAYQATQPVSAPR